MFARKMCRHLVRIKCIVIRILVILERQTHIGIDLFAIAVRRIVRAEQARLGVRKDNIVARVQTLFYQAAADIVTGIASIFLAPVVPLSIVFGTVCFLTCCAGITA